MVKAGSGFETGRRSLKGQNSVTVGWNGDCGNYLFLSTGGFRLVYFMKDYVLCQ